MARVIETTVYQYDELSEAAKAAARDEYRSKGDVWHDSEEYWDSAVEFGKISPITITSANYDNAFVNIEWTSDTELSEISGLRAWKWLQNNDWFSWAEDNKQGKCTMTGAWTDCAFGDAIATYKDKPEETPDLGQVFYEAAQAWVQAARRDLEYAYTDEAIAEFIEINEYEFTEDGKRY